MVIIHALGGYASVPIGHKNQKEDRTRESRDWNRTSNGAHGRDHATTAARSAPDVRRSNEAWKAADDSRRRGVADEGSRSGDRGSRSGGCPSAERGRCCAFRDDRRTRGPAGGDRVTTGFSNALGWRIVGRPRADTPRQLDPSPDAWSGDIIGALSALGGSVKGTLLPERAVIRTVWNCPANNT